MSQQLTRRETTTALIGQTAFFLSIPLPLLAQFNSENDEEIRNAIVRAMEQGLQLRSDILNADVPINLRTLEVPQRDVHYRLELANTLRRHSTEQESHGIQNYIQNDFMPIYNLLREMDVASIPADEDIRNSPISTTCLYTEDPPERILIILGDMVLETLGLIDSGEVFLNFLNHDTRAQEMFYNLAEAVSSMHWEQVARTVEGFFSYLIFGGGLRNLIGFMGENAQRSTIRRISISMSLRLVPFIGWLYLVVAAISTIKSNYHRFSGNDEDRGCAYNY